MADLRGRCKNVEYCANATTQRVITLPDDVPFDCPKCGEPLEALHVAQRTSRNRKLLAVQVLVILAGAGALGYKLLGIGAPPEPPHPATQASALPDTALEPPVGPQAAPTPAQAAPQVPPSAQAAAPQILLRLAGSNIIADRLAHRLAAGYLGLIGDTDITLRQDRVASVTISGNQAGQREGISIATGASGSGFAALLRATADVALSVRPPTAAEADSLASVGDMTSPADEHVIAVDGIAAIVSQANHQTALTTAQLRAIFTGATTDWSQLGAPRGPIHPILQAPDAAQDSASATLLGSARLAGPTILLPTEAAIAKAVAADVHAIGLVSTASAGTAKMLAVGAGGAAPIAPTELAISTEDYPLTRRLTLYTGSAGASGFARRFTDCVASPAGQAAVEAAGFVPLTVHEAPAEVPDTASARFRALVAGATRVSIDFRFQPGSTELDSRSTRDLDRLVGFLRQVHADGHRLILAAFADSSGAPATNLLVSQKRADTVAGALAKLQVIPGKIASFGDDLPVADNATPAGRERNRRVEVYLQK